MNTEIETTILSKQPLTSSPLGAGGPVRVGIVGGAGYTGGELIRLLINHPAVEISFIDSKSNAGKYVHEVHHDLIGETDLKFGSFFNASSGDKIPSYDVLFLCVGHGDARKFLEANAIPDNVKIIDLSQDFRLKELSGYEVKASGNQQPTTRKFVYGLPELNKSLYSNRTIYCQSRLFCECHTTGFTSFSTSRLAEQRYLYYRHHWFYRSRAGFIGHFPF